MRKIDDDEMFRVLGGADPVLVTSIVGVIVTLVIGILHGYSNPKKCN